MILSDFTIEQLCTPPTHMVNDGGHAVHAWSGITHTAERLVVLETQERVWAYSKDDVAVSEFKPMISPFFKEQVREVDGQKIVSYGLSSYGYDVRLGRKFKIFSNALNGMIDPLNPDPNCFVEHEGDFCIIPPNSYILGHTLETFNIPQDILTVCLGKSTYARLAAIVNVTPIEPGFKGEVVIEIANCSTLPLKVYAGMGIAQFLFFRGDRPCRTSYADRGGKYQGQTGVQTALV
jgi:dCTP deaminase